MMISHTDSSEIEIEEIINCAWCKKIAGKKIKMISIDIDDKKIILCPVCQSEAH